MSEDIDKSISRLQEEAYKEGRRSMKKKLIAEFLTDFETVIEYFKLDGHLVGALRKKWEARRQSGATDK